MWPKILSSLNLSLCVGIASDADGSLSSKSKLFRQLFISLPTFVCVVLDTLLLLVTHIVDGFIV